MPPVNLLTVTETTQNVPREVKRRRYYSLETMRRMGTPVILKHMYNIADVEEGIAERSPWMDDIYGQTRAEDPLSYGVGFVSVERSDNEWISPQGKIVVSNIHPGVGFTPAPKYRGYGQGYLTYVIMPDVAEDLFRLDPAGTFVRIQSATAQMAWYPPANDNDILTLVEIDRNARIVKTHERYQLKRTTPVSIRGRDRRGRRNEPVDFGNQYIINQTFEMALVPPNNIIYQVPMDR